MSYNSYIHILKTCLCFRVADLTEQSLETKYFGTLTPQYFIANLVDMQGAFYTGQFNVYLQDLNSTTGDRGTLHANVNYYQTFHPYPPNKQPKLESFSILQASKYKMGDQELKEKLRYMTNKLFKGDFS